MGDPKRIRKKYDKSKLMWNKERIEREHGIRDRYGLANLRELWKATTEINRIRRNARQVLSGRAGGDVGNDIIARLARYGIVKREATLDDTLSITPEMILERRLQSIVFRKGMAKTIKQSRQLITHGFIAVDGHKVKSPGYMVTGSEEGKIAYYKPIKIEFEQQPQPPQTEAKVEPQKAEGAGA